MHLQLLFEFQNLPFHVGKALQADNPTGPAAKLTTPRTPNESPRAKARFQLEGRNCVPSFQQSWKRTRGFPKRKVVCFHDWREGRMTLSKTWILFFQLPTGRGLQTNFAGHPLPFFGRGRSIKLHMHIRFPQTHSRNLGIFVPATRNRGK